MVHDGFHLNNLLLRFILVLSVVNPKDGEKASCVLSLIQNNCQRASEHATTNVCTTRSTGLQSLHSVLCRSVGLQTLVASGCLLNEEGPQSPSYIFKIFQKKRECKLCSHRFFGGQLSYKNQDKGALTYIKNLSISTSSQGVQFSLTGYLKAVELCLTLPYIKPKR